MNFELTEEQEMFRKMAREFAERELVTAGAELDRTGEYPHGPLKKIAPLGLLGTTIPQKYGGLELPVLTWVIINEQLAWGSVSIAGILMNSMLPGSILSDAANEEQKQKYLPPMCRGEKIYAVAAAEPNAGSDGGNIHTMAALDGDSWVLNGNKTFVTNGSVGDMVITLVQTDKNKKGKGLALIAVEKGTPGMFCNSIPGLNGMRCDDIAQIRFDECRVPKGNLVNEVGKGLKTALGGITNMRIAIPSYCVGGAQRCIDICVKYAQERTQFDKPIGSFQLVQGMLAEMEMNKEAAKLLTRRAAYNKDHGLPYLKEVSIAKLFTTEMVVQITVKAIRIHGGYGGFEDYTVERINREVINFLAPGGTCEVHKLTIGRQMLGLDAMAR